MNGKMDLAPEQERAILDLMRRITLIQNLDELLKVVVEELPKVVGARGCWIYLRPQYVPEYHQIVVRGKREFTEQELPENEEFVVLAATNYAKSRPLVGKAYFASGEGVTGWVFKSDIVLRVQDVSNPQELAAKGRDLVWKNFYQDGEDFYQPGEPRPLLVVPLKLNQNVLGVLKFHATLDGKPFLETFEKVAIIVAQIISGVINQAWMLDEQSLAISRLIEITSKQRPTDVIQDVLGSMKDMLDCTKTQFFWRNEDGSKIRLVAQNPPLPANAETVGFERGLGLIGWVFKTGRPLMLPDVRMALHGITLDMELLKKYSDGEEVNPTDCFIRSDEKPEFYTGKLQSPVAFLAVPVQLKDGEMQGVVCAYRNSSKKLPFDHTHLRRGKSLANTIALSLENNRQRKLSDLMIKLGHLTDVRQLFETVVKNIPGLVTSRGCSIYLLESEGGENWLRLAYTSREEFIKTDALVPIVYQIGQGKTGVCARMKATLVVNHFGKGSVSQRNLEAEQARIKERHPYNLVQELKDQQENTVGLIQLKTPANLSFPERLPFKELALSMVYGENGLPSQILLQHASDKASTSCSFIAIPIKNRNDLLGVITVARSIPQTPFSADDVSLVESIAGHLASVMTNLKMQDQRRRLMISLAHEVNTPLIGMLADSENLWSELPENSELRNIAKHNMEQVLRLHLQTSTILAVMSERQPVRQFSEHSIYRPLKEACEMFESEAAQKGCDIVGPRALDTTFPTIEMSLLDLTIAFKNILHNAVKYSFRPPASNDRSRYVKVWGAWDKESPQHFVVYVQNYGVGITPEEISKGLIFEPFYRGEKASDRQRTGSGFGLAHAKQVIEDMHHGKITAQSTPQGGDAYLTTFTIRLPLRQPSRHIVKGEGDGKPNTLD